MIVSDANLDLVNSGRIVIDALVQTMFSGIYGRLVGVCIRNKEQSRKMPKMLA